MTSQLIGTTKLPALYVLANEYVEAADKLHDLDLPAEVIADTLEGMAGDMEAKCQNVAMAIRNIESLAEQIKQAEEQMATRRKALEARAASVRAYLLTNMQRCEISKIESPWFSITRKKNPPKVVIDGVIPEIYMRQKPPPEPEPDKKAIAEALKAGVKVGECRLEQGESLVIK